MRRTSGKEIVGIAVNYQQNRQCYFPGNAGEQRRGCDGKPFEQAKLIELGWLTGEADGVYGDATREAVLNLQKYANSQLGMSLNESGIADNDTLDLLLSENPPVNPS